MILLAAAASHLMSSVLAFFHKAKSTWGLFPSFRLSLWTPWELFSLRLKCKIKRLGPRAYDQYMLCSCQHLFSSWLPSECFILSWKWRDVPKLLFPFGAWQTTSVLSVVPQDEKCSPPTSQFCSSLIFATLYFFTADPTSNCAIGNKRWERLWLRYLGRFIPTTLIMWGRGGDPNDRRVSGFSIVHDPDHQGVVSVFLIPGVNLSKLSQFIFCTLPLLCSNRTFPKACRHYF